jgi:hypothetical protein
MLIVFAGTRGSASAYQLNLPAFIYNYGQSRYLLGFRDPNDPVVWLGYYLLYCLQRYICKSR